MPDSGSYSYVGNELELFLQAVNWKQYWSSRLRPFVHGDVLDVGAGLGATFDYLGAAAASWTCLEPDATLCKRLTQRLSAHARPPHVICGTLAALPVGQQFDTIVYIDVLEHIEHDAQQLESAVHYLRPGGSLIVLAPALPALYSAFDRSIGHFRRYTRASLANVAPPTLRVADWFFLDCLGVLASLFARLAKQTSPSPRQVELWDKAIVPVSRVADRVSSRLFGRTLVMIWKNERQPAPEANTGAAAE